ncbi:MAG: adenylate kinase [SAR202 cluster bacterium Io17-Chloro-G4]|nr:MAG: adenylate kinase [SAR202 cluster bacterium Io17-Chloro-G4]
MSSAENSNLRLVLFGPPGAGKGTQAQLLRDRLNLAHVSSGDLFRQNLNNNTPLGLKAAEYMKQGHLVPDEVTIDIVLDKVLSLNSEEGFILDGFPRNRYQAEVLEKALAQRSRGIDKVVHIDVCQEELIRRLAGRFNCRDCQAPHSIDKVAFSQEDLKCGQCGGELYQREDDRPEAVQRRIEVYQRETLPVLDYYREKDLLLDVSGLDTVEKVNKDVLAGLGVI